MACLFKSSPVASTETSVKLIGTTSMLLNKPCNNFQRSFVEDGRHIQASAAVLSFFFYQS